MKSIAIVVSLIILTVSTSGCATIVHGRSQDVALASTPPGATVKIDGVQTTTPGKVTLRRDQDYNATFEKEGYSTRQVKIEKEGSWWLLGNIIFGGIIGLIIDLAAGGAYDLEPDSVDIDLGTGVVKEIEKPKEAEAAQPPQ